jgi:acyl transferase domain-containing protein
MTVRTSGEDNSFEGVWSQALSAIGRCRSFDAQGDGYGRGEGFAVAVLYPAASQRDTNRVVSLATIRATAVNQDGRSSSMTAPNGPSQSALINTAMQAGGLLVNQACAFPFGD